MAQLGRLIQTVIDTIGNAVSGQSVTVYRRGAHANGSSSGTTPLTITVNNPGRIVAGDTVIIDGGSTSYSVDSVTDTTVVVSGFAGTLAVTDDQRITPTNSKPTLYVDAFAGESISNPLTTTSTGLASCWLPPGFVDVIVSGSGVTTTVIPDVLVVGQDDRVNVHWFGALGDGSTNDTTAIQNAIDYAYNRDLSIVYLPSGNYKASTINLKQGISLIGSGMNPSPHGIGTTLTQISGSNVDFIKSDSSLSATDYQHWSVIRNLRILGNSGDTTGSGIKWNSRVGEGAKFEHLHVSDFPESGIEIVEGCVPLYAEDLHLFSNGLYGLDINVSGSSPNQTILVNLLSGDNNATALCRIRTSSGTNQGQGYVLSGIKAEKSVTGKQNDVIVLDNMNGTPVSIIGLAATNTTAEAANSGVKVITSNCRLFWTGVNVSDDYTYNIDDQFNSRTFGRTFSFGAMDYFPAHTIGIVDGVTAPSTVTGFAVIYVDAADGDLKVKFSDGFVRVIVADS